MLLWLLLVREITVLSLAALDPAVHLTWGDVSVDDLGNPAVMCIKLKWSKCDQFGVGVNVHVGRTYTPLCPVTAMLAYMMSRQHTPGPFFRDEQGQHLTKVRFIHEIRKALSQLGLPAEQFVGHSFQIRAATAAAQAGLEDSVIQALGRWSSPAFLLMSVSSSVRHLMSQSYSHLAQTSQASNVRNNFVLQLHYVHTVPYSGKLSKG